MIRQTRSLILLVALKCLIDTMYFTLESVAPTGHYRIIHWKSPSISLETPSVLWIRPEDILKAAEWQVIVLINPASG